ncbi:hypothetical protein [Archangium minus]|uniref:hypothetical protein n=1 Tax=Archangium minus TaxID=83450 RepID=UPI0037C186CE
MESHFHPCDFTCEPLRHFLGELAGLDDLDDASGRAHDPGSRGHRDAGHGVGTPRAAAVAVITVGLSGDLHIPDMPSHEYSPFPRELLIEVPPEPDTGSISPEQRCTWFNVDPVEIHGRSAILLLRRLHLFFDSREPVVQVVSNYSPICGGEIFAFCVDIELDVGPAIFFGAHLVDDPFCDMLTATVSLDFHLHVAISPDSGFDHCHESVR